MTSEPSKERQFAEAVPADSIHIVESTEQIGDSNSSNEPAAPHGESPVADIKPLAASNSLPPSESTEPPAQTSSSSSNEPAEPAQPLFQTSTYIPSYSHSESPAYLKEPFKKRSIVSKYLPDLKQVFNTVYFSIAAISVLSLSGLWNLPPLALLGAVFLTFTVASIYFSIRKSAHEDDFAVTIPTKLRKQLRLYAVLAPLPLIIAAAVLCPANFALQRGVELNTLNKFQDAIPPLAIASVLNPKSEKTLDALALAYNRTADRISALSAADAALNLNPNDSVALAHKAWAQESIGQHDSAVKTALEAIALDPKSGIAYGSLAYAYYNSGQYELAQDAATTHIQLHNNEASAYELRAKILDELGRSEKAAADRAKAAELWPSFATSKLPEH
jgi:tetratricopeptide (TPR) repeat protein